MAKTVKGDWTSASFDDSNWPNAVKILEGNLKGKSDGLAWQLVPSILPQMELTYQRIPKLRWAKGMNAPLGFQKLKLNLI